MGDPKGHPLTLFFEKLALLTLVGCRLRPLLGVSSDYRRLFAEKRPPDDFSKPLPTTQACGDYFWRSYHLGRLLFSDFQNPKAGSCNDK